MFSQSGKTLTNSKLNIIFRGHREVLELFRRGIVGVLSPSAGQTVN